MIIIFHTIPCFTPNKSKPQPINPHRPRATTSSHKTKNQQPNELKKLVGVQTHLFNLPIFQKPCFLPNQDDKEQKIKYYTYCFNSKVFGAKQKIESTPFPGLE